MESIKSGGVKLVVLLKHRLGATPLPPLSVQISCRISKVKTLPYAREFAVERSHE